MCNFDESHLVYTLKLSDEDSHYRPDPFPGSKEAVLEGCTCPDEQPWPGKMAISGNCPVHVLESIKPN